MPSKAKPLTGAQLLAYESQRDLAADLPASVLKMRAGNTGLHQRPARDTDLPFLLQLRAATMGPHRQAAGISESLSQRQEKVRSHFASANILEIDGRPIGLLKVVRQAEQWELLQLQLSPEFQGQGLGTRLVSELLTEAQAAKVPLRLSVLKVNPACRLYERLGFKQVSESEFGYRLEVGR